MGVTDIHEAADLAEVVCGSAGTVDAALALLEAEPSIRARIVERFELAVRERISDRQDWHVVRNDLGPERHAGFLIGFAPDSEIGFGFQFDRAGYGLLFYGVASQNARTLPARTKPALQTFMNSSRGTDHWPIWKSVGPNDRHFPLTEKADREFWTAAYDGRLADMLVRFVGEAETALTAAGLLAAVRAR